MVLAYEVRHACNNLKSENQEPHRQVGTANGLSSICHPLTFSTLLISCAVLSSIPLLRLYTDFSHSTYVDRPLFFQNKNSLATFWTLFRLADSAPLVSPGTPISYAGHLVQS